MVVEFIWTWKTFGFIIMSCGFVIFVSLGFMFLSVRLEVERRGEERGGEWKEKGRGGGRRRRRGGDDGMGRRERNDEGREVRVVSRRKKEKKFVGGKE